MRLLAPLINDVATDLDDPPSYRVAAHGPMSARLRDIVRRHYPELQTLHCPLSVPATFEIALAVARGQNGWSVHVVDPDEGLIEAVAVTRSLGFRDDVVIRVRKAETGAAVDLRSASRVGRGDFGTNAARIVSYSLAFLDALPG